MKFVGSVLGQNGWVLVALGPIGLAVTFMLGGWGWTIAGVILFLGLAVAALGNSSYQSYKALQQANPPSGSAPPDGLVDETSGIPSPADDLAQAGPEPGADGADAAGAQEQSAAKGKEDSAPGNEDDDPDGFTEMFERAWDGDVSGVEAASKRYLAEASDEEDRLFRRSRILLLRSKAGDLPAIRELRHLSSDHPENLEIVHALALALEWAGSLSAAADVMLAAAARTTDEDHLTSLRTQASERLREARRLDEALSMSRQAIDCAKDDGARAGAWYEHGLVLIEMDRDVASVCALEAAVALSPANTEIRFRLAYQYSQLGLSVMAIHHYQALLSTNAKSAMSLNNIGYEFERLGKQFGAMSHYRKSAELGETLASANLASSFISIGAAAEAQQVIEDARSTSTSSTLNALVVSAEARLVDAKAEEASSTEQILHTAATAQRVVASWIPGLDELPSGDWVIDGGAMVNLVENEGTARGEVGEKSTRKQYDFSQEQGGLKVSIAQGAYGSTTYTGWAGYADNGDLLLVTKSPHGGDLMTSTLRRATTTTTS